MNRTELPADVIARTALLLARGGMAAFFSLIVLCGGAVLLLAAGLALCQGATSDPLSMPAVLLVLVAGPVTLVLLHAGPLAAFRRALDGDASFGDCLRDTFAVARLVGPNVFLAYVFAVPLLVVGVALVLSYVVPTDDPTGRFVLCLFGAALATVATWLYGLVVVEGGARTALGLFAIDPFRERRHATAVTFAGALPFLAAVTFAGGRYVQHAGAFGVSLPDGVLVVVGVIGVALAHVVACALGTALAAPAREREQVVLELAASTAS